jgi:radical SAM superfamily enzyme YgiQ (UPF0313 family)
MSGSNQENIKVFLTHGYFIREDPKEQVIMKPYPPLGILYVSAFLEQQGISNFIFDSTFSDFEKLSHSLIEKRPSILGIYTNLMTKVNVLRIIRFVKENESLKNTKVILGGPEVRYHIDKFLNHGADFLVVGEGEESMYELCQFILTEKPDQNNPTKTDELKKISGIAFLDGENVCRTDERILKKDLDSLPFPNRKKIALKLYLEAWKVRHGSSTISVSTMRGCPYTCKWCSRAVYGQSYRRRSPASVLDELQDLQSNYNFDTIWFVDDVFTISHKWLEQFRREVENRKLQVRYECITRADRLNETVIQDLKASGCFRVWIGAESGSQKILDAMDRRVDAEKVQEMIQMAKKAGLETGTFIMVGYPGETESDLEQTIKHLKKADPDHYTLTLAYPITGTELFKETENIFLNNIDWATATDREIDFRRTYPRRYYDFAIRRIHNEVSYAKSRKSHKGQSIRSGTFKLKALAAKAAMALSRFV